MSLRRLLIVDDNDVDREHIQRLLGDRYAYAEAATSAEALAATARSAPSCVLLDFRLPDRDGLDALDDLHKLGLPVVMLTGQGDETVAVEAMKRGAQDYLVKGRLDAASLVRAVENAVEKAELRERLQRQQQELEAQVEELSHRRAELESANRALAERQEQLNVLMRHLPAVIWTTDPELRHTSLAGSLRTIDGDAPPGVGCQVGFSLEDREHREQLRAAHRAALAGQPRGFEVQLRGRWVQGHVEPLRDRHDKVVGAIGVGLDVSDTRSLQQQLLHAQKMEAVGQLAGGIAHDFNNILTVVLSYGKFVLADLPPEHPSRPDVQEIVASGERAAALTRQLLAFSRKQVYEPQVVDLNRVLESMQKMLVRVLGEDIELMVSAASGLGAVHADPGYLEQVVLNLAVNARDAMPRGGKLTIETANVEFLGDSVPGHLEAKPGRYAMLAVTDTGTGIPDDVRERIFEPFFTTKPEGRGTGLGLATVYGIVKQAGGDIQVHSAVGQGTTFKVYLPRLESSGLAALPASGGRKKVTGTEHLLLVEDEPKVRAVARRALTAAGYRVSVVESADEALELLRSGVSVNLLLTDVILPGMNGRELVERVHEGWPTVAVLYMSGYTGSAHVHQAVFEAGTPYLQKPFTPAQIVEKVRAVLDAKQGTQLGSSSP